MHLMNYLKQSTSVFLILVVASCGSNSSTIENLSTNSSSAATVTIDTTIPMTQAEILSKGQSCEQAWKTVPTAIWYDDMSESDKTLVRTTLYSCSDFSQWELWKDTVIDILGIYTGGDSGPLQQLCSDEPRANRNVCISQAEFVAKYESFPNVSYRKFDTSVNRPSCSQFWQASLANIDNEMGDVFLRATLYSCTSKSEWLAGAASIGEDGSSLLPTACLLEPNATTICG